MAHQISILILGILALCASGCAVSPEVPAKNWYNPAKSSADMAQDQAECQLEAQGGARNILGYSPETRIKQLFNECMTARGYQLVDKAGIH